MDRDGGRFSTKVRIYRDPFLLLINQRRQRWRLLAKKEISDARSFEKMSGDTTSDEEGSQEDSPRYDIDDMEIVKTIGTGTFGRVVLCRHRGKPLALKILSMADVIRLKQVEHVRNEITVLKEVPQRALTPPIRPRVKAPGDPSCFDDYPETDWRSQPALPADQLALFQDF
ncbi:hypothetical protein M0804_011577 [Polistes exclamans]|nr:hypothetical protein M0804_011577 [Polistes exclamans]